MTYAPASVGAFFCFTPQRKKKGALRIGKAPCGM